MGTRKHIEMQEFEVQAAERIDACIDLGYEWMLFEPVLRQVFEEIKHKLEVGVEIGQFECEVALSIVFVDVVIADEQ